MIIFDFLVVAAFMYGVLNAHQMNQVMSQEIIDERSKQDLILDRGVYLASQNWQIDFGGANRDVISSSFIPKSEALSFITQLETLAEERGLQPRFDLGQVDSQLETVQRLPLKISVNGSYQRLLEYINSLEKLPYYLQIQDIRFDHQEAGGGETDSAGTVQLVVTFITFWH